MRGGRPVAFSFQALTGPKWTHGVRPVTRLGQASFFQHVLLANLKFASRAPGAPKALLCTSLHLTHVCYLHFKTGLVADDSPRQRDPPPRLQPSSSFALSTLLHLGTLWLVSLMDVTKLNLTMSLPRRKAISQQVVSCGSMNTKSNPHNASVYVCMQPSAFEQPLEHFTTSEGTMSSETKVR